MLQGKGDKPTEATEEAKSEESAVTQVLPSLCTSSWNVWVGTSYHLPVWDIFHKDVYNVQINCHVMYFTRNLKQ